MSGQKEIIEHLENSCKDLIDKIVNPALHPFIGETGEGEEAYEAEEGGRAKRMTLDAEGELVEAADDCPMEDVVWQDEDGDEIEVRDMDAGDLMEGALSIESITIDATSLTISSIEVCFGTGGPDLRAHVYGTGRVQAVGVWGSDRIERWGRDEIRLFEYLEENYIGSTIERT